MSAFARCVKQHRGRKTGRAHSRLKSHSSAVLIPKSVWLPMNVRDVFGPQVKYHFDNVSADYVEGWAFSPKGLDSIEIQIDGATVGVTTPKRSRPDVATAIPGAPADTGFYYRFAPGSFSRSQATLTVRFKQNRGGEVASDPILIPNVHSPEPGTSTAPESTPSPLPAPIHSILCQLRGEEVYNPPWTDELIHQAVEDLRFIAQRGTRHLPHVYHYLGFLRMMWAKFEFVLGHFPKFNESSNSDKDSIAIASSVPEMLSIANYLYILKSRGLQGRFAEFGCFKGFSTSMLSEACYQLGIPMDVFDSFSGLPPSDSPYYRAGEFMGSLPEVQRNVSAFGKIESVTFHPGFFADSLPKANLLPICIWMDVDLESSSRDVMKIVGSLPVESCLFSHECSPEYFLATGVQAVRGTDSVMGPIVDGFRENGREITGRFLFGNTGAFWDRRYGTPVMPVDELLRIKDLALS